MAEEFNPFLLQGYAGADTFCDRVEELASLKEAMTNQRNVTLISLRRLGKTALIRHFFASERRFTAAFVDLYRTTNQQDMVLRIAQETLRQVGKPTGVWLKEVASAIRSLEFNLQFDAITGLPEVGVRFIRTKAKLALDDSSSTWAAQAVVLALDEFQQGDKYPEKNTEAVLREKCRSCGTCSSSSPAATGADAAIFTDGKRPFFQATGPCPGPINEEYAAFISRHFKAE